MSFLAVMVFTPAVVMADDFNGTAGDDTHDHANNTDDDIDGEGGEDTLDGSGGNDTVDGGADDDHVVHGGDGDDEVHGGEGNDGDSGLGHGVMGDGVEQSGAGTATLDGGDDQLVDGGGGDDNQVLGDGQASSPDTAHLIGGDDTVRGGSGNDFWVHGDGLADCYGCLAVSATVDGGDDDVDGGDGVDTQVWGDGYSEASNDSTVNGGDDFVTGGGDDDPSVFGDGFAYGAVITLLSGGNDHVDGGDGTDQVYGDGAAQSDQASSAVTLTGGIDTVLGGLGNDGVIGDGEVTAGPGATNSTATLNGGADTIDGGAGDDVAQGDGVVHNYAAGGTSVLTGGNDIIVNAGGNGDGFAWNHDTAGADAILNGGNDSITGNETDDVIYGDGQVHNNGTGLSRLNGGDDTIDGADGNDRLVGDGWISDDNLLTALVTGGDDTIRGGAGNDILWGDSGNIAIAQNVVGGNDLLFGDAGNDEIFGGSGSDQVEGGTGDDLLFGEAGNDLLLGGEGNDDLDGGSGSDFLCGGSGNNTVKGGAGSDLQCAVDDAITVTEDGGTINVAVNEELDDADSADRAGRRFEIVSISGDLKAVIDNETGRLTIFEADSGGRIQYRVWLIDGSFESFGTVFVALSRTFDEPEPEEEEEENPEDRIDPVEVITITPITDPVEVPDAPAPADTPQRDDPSSTGSEGERSLAPGDPGFKSETVAQLLDGPLAPVVTVGVAGTVITAVTGGAGLASQSLSGRTSGSSGRAAASGGSARGAFGGGGGAAGAASSARSAAGAGGSASRMEGASDRFMAIARGVGPGDRSFTWRFPGWRRLDRLSSAGPHRFAPFSPLVARLAIDGSEIRAMFGSLWYLTPAAGLAIGGLAAHMAGGEVVPPPLWLLLAGAILTTFDALAGAIASTVYIASGILTGAMFNADSPDLVHSLLVYCGVGFLWTSIPLVGSAMRPFRRIGEGNVRHAWDVVADLAIASLLCAWVTRGLMASMDSFAGHETGLPAHASLIALTVFGFVALRIISENAATRLYPLRLQSVESSADFPEPTLLADLGGIALRTFLFAFIGHSFIGSCWQWWVGTALYCIPQVMGALDVKFERVEWIHRLLPRGITLLFVMLLAAAAVIKLASVVTSSDLETVRWVFMLLAIPPLVFAVLESFADESSKATTWVREFLGLGVVVATAWLAFNGWSL